MKNLILAIGIFFSFGAQSQTFDGIPISGDLTTIISKFKAKGYTHKTTEDGVPIMKGKLASIYNVEVFIFTTPKTKKVSKIVAYLDEQQNWYTIKGEYEKLLNILINKYGTPDSKYDFFSSPYFEGDGFEMTAVASEKCSYAAYWFAKENTNIAIEISKYKQVKLAYENEANMKIATKEIESMTNSSF